MTYPLLDLPRELLENVLLCIDAAKDLLYLALTCKYLAEIIIPDHLNFIDIWSPIHNHNTAIWRTLKTYPNLAKRILKLYIIFDWGFDPEQERASGYKPGLQYAWNRMHAKRYVAPGSISSEEEPYALFNSALQNMENMLYFTLKQAMPVTQFHEALISISNRCRQLHGLYVDMSHERLGHEIPLQALSFPRLTNFTLLSYWDACTFCENVFTRIIFGSPLLTNICIVSKRRHCFNCPEFFTNGNWPNLRRLSCDGFFNFYPPAIQQDDDLKLDIAVSFFKRHPLLECLYIDHGHSPPLVKAGTFLRRSAFPSMRSLYISSPNPTAFTDKLRHISNLQFFPVSTFEQLISLRSCTLTTNDIGIVTSLVNAVPGLERLDLYYFISNDWKCPRGVQSHTYPEQCLCHKKEVRTIISGLRNLTHLVLHLPEYFGTRDPMDFCDIICDLPWLRYLQLVNAPYLVERTDDDLIVCHLLRPSIHEPCHPQNWGDFYYASYGRWGF